MFFKPKAKLQGDLISREELKKNKFLIPDIQFVGGRSNGKTIERITLAYNKGWNAAIDAIYENAPAVKEEQPKGHWACIEDDNYAGGGYWECPSCKDRFSFQGFNLLNDMPYCPKCGGRVKTESEVEND